MGFTLPAAGGEKASATALVRRLEAVQRQVADRFVILERGPQDYMQCLCTEQGWILEKREGGGDCHYRAMVLAKETDSEDMATRILSKKPPPRLYLTYDELIGEMIAYLDGTSSTRPIEWQQVDVD